MAVRLCPGRALPPYAFTPGKFPHPEKPGGHMHGQGKIEVAKLDPAHPWDNEDFLYALDLFNHGYFWEAHVWLEDLWNKAGRVGSIGDFLKALIMICAAGVKLRLADPAPLQGHLERAKELLTGVRKGVGDHFAGLDLDDLLRVLQVAQETPQSFFPQGLVPRR